MCTAGATKGGYRGVMHRRSELSVTCRRCRWVTRRRWELGIIGRQWELKSRTDSWWCSDPCPSGMASWCHYGAFTMPHFLQCLLCLSVSSQVPLGGIDLDRRLPDCQFASRGTRGKLPFSWGLTTKIWGCYTGKTCYTDRMNRFPTILNLLEPSS